MGILCIIEYNFDYVAAVSEENVDEAFMSIAKSIRMEFDPKEGEDE